MSRPLTVFFLFFLMGDLGFTQTLLRVPQDLPTIQAAIDSAVNGDTVLVAEGTYIENIVIRKKITVASLYLYDGDTSHISNTVIDGSNPSYSDSGAVVTIAAGTDTTTVLTGFTITAGIGTAKVSSQQIWRVGGGIDISAGGARIVRNYIAYNSVTSYRSAAAGINVWDETNTGKIGYVYVESNVIAHNVAQGAEAYGGGLGMVSGYTIIRNNIITRNFASSGGGGIDAPGGSSAIVNNTIVNNESGGGIPGIRSLQLSVPRLLNNIIWNPGRNIEFLGAADVAYNNLIRGGSFVGSNINMDPGFTDTTTFTIPGGSPSISAGQDSMTIRSIKLYAPSTDIYGNPRPNPPGSKPDLGAVESSAQSSSLPSQMPQLFSKSINSRGTTRSYVLYVPKNYDALVSLPLVIVLHGCGGNSIGATSVGMNNLADTAGFAVAYPKSVGTCWDDGFPGATATTDIDFISDLIDSLSLFYKINSNMVYVSGFSSGGFLTFRLAAELGNRLAAIAPVAATLPNFTAYGSPLSKPVPMVYFFGTTDGQVSYNGGTNYQSVDSTLIKWLSYNGCQPTADTVDIANSDATDGSSVQRIRYLSCVSGQPVYFYKVAAGGHNWPGTSHGALTYNRDIHASIEMWNFFKGKLVVSVPGTGNQLPDAFAMFQNYPNPFNPSTTIRFELPHESPVRLSIFNLLGQRVTTLVDDVRQAGVHAVEWNAGSEASGVYFYRIDAGGNVTTKKLMLLR